MPAPAPAPAGNGASQEALKLQLDRVKREREDLRKKLVSGSRVWSSTATVHGEVYGSPCKHPAAPLSMHEVLLLCSVSWLRMLVGLGKVKTWVRVNAGCSHENEGVKPAQC
eukprot:scaffold198475_cov18-Tisochrysis_lutea.AAC.1